MHSGQRQIRISYSTIGYRIRLLDILSDYRISYPTIGYVFRLCFTHIVTTWNEEIFIGLTYQHMLKYLTTLAFWWASDCTSRSTAFFPLAAVMSIDSSNECKIDLQLRYGQNRVEDVFNKFQIRMPVFPSTWIYRLPIQAKYKANNASSTRAGPGLVHHGTSNCVCTCWKTAKVVSKHLSECLWWAWCISLHGLCKHPLLPRVGNR